MKLKAETFCICLKEIFVTHHKISTHSDNSYFVRFHEILFQTDAESFSFLSWKTKKNIFQKKYNLGGSLLTGQESSKRRRLLSQFSLKGLTEVTQKLSQKRTLLGLLLLDGVDSVRVLASKIIVAITIMKSHLNFGFLTRPHDTWWSTFGALVSMWP